MLARSLLCLIPFWGPHLRFSAPCMCGDQGRKNPKGTRGSGPPQLGRALILKTAFVRQGRTAQPFAASRGFQVDP